MNSVKQNFLYYVKKYHIKYMLLIVLLYVIKLVLYETSSFINSDYSIITMKIDSLIPFCKYFILFYTTYYWFPILQLYLLSFADKRKFYRLLIAIGVSCLIANVIFWIYQVKMIRPEITDSTIFDWMINFIYKIDKEALNCFPSVHALMGCGMVIGGLKTKKFPHWLRIISFIFGIGCIVSTVFIKQHYFIDMLVGMLLMVIVYLIVLVIDEKIVKKKTLQNVN